MNLILALCWLFLGVAVLAWQTLTGDTRWYVPVVHVSYAWLMFLLTAYNLVRWLRVRAEKKRQLNAQRAAPAVRRARPVSQEPPNPDFNFGE